MPIPPTWFKTPTFVGQPIEVKVKHYSNADKEVNDANLDKAISQLKKLLEKDGKMNEIRERKYFCSKARTRYLKRKQFIYKLKLKKKKSKKFMSKSNRKKRIRG